MNKKILILLLVAISASIGLAKSKKILEISFDKTTNLQRSGAVIEMQDNNKPALVFGKSGKPQSMMYFWLKKKQCKNKTLKISITAKGQELSRKFIFSLQAQKDGKRIWPGGYTQSGTFDWKKFSFTINFSELGIDAGAIRLGLQNTTGKLWVRNLIIADITSNNNADIGKRSSIPYSTRYGSVNFKPNKFHVPDYHASRNLIQNPSFEAGSDFWVAGCWGALNRLPADGKPLLSLDTTTAAEGKVSMCQRVIPGGKGGWPPATFAIPLEQGQKYTLSFYAKTDSPDTANFVVAGITDVWDTFLPKKKYKLDKSWKRYTYQFKSPKKMVQLQLGCPRKANPCRVWIDAIQLEKGNKATEFTRIPVAVALKTDTAHNLSQPGEKINACLQISTPLPDSGSIDYVICDFFDNIIKEGTLSFRTVQQNIPVELQLPICDTLDSGVYTIEATTSLSEGFSHTTWHRLVRMNYTTKPFKHRNFFSISGAKGAGNWEPALKMLKNIGFGSFCFVHTPPDDYKKLLKKYGFMSYGDVFHSTGWPARILGKYNIKDPKTIKDEDIPQIVDHCLKTISDNPDFLDFETVNEPFCHTEEDIAHTVKILKEVRKAAKKVNPKIRMMTPDCANIDHTMKYLDVFFEKGGADACDIVALHTYRGHPDALDGDLSKVIGLTNKYKPGAEVWSTEGGYYNTYIIPDIGFRRVTHGGDHYRTGNMSYDLGLGEKIALAYQTRFRVQALKYADRMKIDVDWNNAGDTRTYFGLDMIPTAPAFATNTPARFLGNSDFVADLELPTDLRGYLFKDAKNRPVAVLWFRNDQETLYKGQNPAEMDISKIANKFDAFNVVGAPIKNRTKLKLTGYPVFLRGESGKVEEFKTILENASYKFPDVGEQLDHTFELKADGSFLSKFTNRFNKELKGKLVCKIAGKTVFETNLNLKPYGTFEKQLKFPVSTEDMTTVHYSYRFIPKTGEELAKDLAIKYFSAKKVPENKFNIDANWDEWKNISQIATDNTRTNTIKDSLKVDTAWAWNENKLYCLIDVKDKTFEPSKTIQFPTMGDNVEIFFDSFADAVKLKHHKYEGYAEDDQYYTMWFNKNFTADAFRTQEAHWQLSFNKPGRASKIKSRYQLTKDGYRLKIAFPIREIKPIELNDKGCFGMNVLVRNYINGKRVATSIFGQGETPCSWRSPKNYVFMFLEPGK